jgi:outer membrane protein assembly factor BamB
MKRTNKIQQAGIALLLAGLAAGAAGAEAGQVADQTIIPPAGDHKVVELVLENAAHGGGYGAGGWMDGKNTVVRGAFRDGKLKLPSRLSVRDITSTLTVDAASIKGEAIVQAQPRSFNELRCAIDAKIEGGKVTGTWETADKKSKGTVSGWVRTEEELKKTNAFTTKADWPCWNGPFTSMAATPCGLQLVEDPAKDARLMWRSEELCPNGNGNALNYNNLCFSDRTMGGGASVVVAEGKVFINYYQPSGSEYMKDYTGKPGPEVLEELAKKMQPPLPEITGWMKEKYLVKADDVVVCMDAATGKTLWKNIFAEKSMNQPSHKGGVVNNTPCAGGGKVFAMGPGGCLHGMDIATGKVLWERTKMSAQGVNPWSGSRNQCTAPIYAGGVLILPDHGSTLTGIDPETGKDLWKLPGKGYHFQVPAKWSHAGQEYVISIYVAKADEKAGNMFNAVCVEPKTGKVLWDGELLLNLTKGVSVFGDSMYGAALTTATDGSSTCTSWRLTLQKPERLWQTPTPGIAGDPPPSADGKHVVVGGLEKSYLLDAAAGRILATVEKRGPGNEGHTMIAEDRVIISHDGSHGGSGMTFLAASPDSFSKPFGWSQPHPQTTSYHNKYMTFPIVEGRLFMRGYDGVYCYDLRKQ